MEASKQRVAVLLLAGAILVTCAADQCAPVCEKGSRHRAPHPQDCGKFYQCSQGIAYPMSCPTDLHFSPSTKHCQHRDQAKCLANSNADCGTFNSRSAINPISHRQRSEESTCKPRCPFVGAYIPHPQDCTKFYVCGADNVAVEYSCQPGLYYDMELLRCEWPNTANCIAGSDHACDELLKPESETKPEPTQPKPVEPETPTSVPSSCKPPCPWAGAYIPHPQDCTKFYVCGADMVPIEYSCQPGLYYNANNMWCDYPNQANCIAGPDHACDELLEV